MTGYKFIDLERSNTGIFPVTRRFILLQSRTEEIDYCGGSVTQNTFIHYLGRASASANCRLRPSNLLINDLGRTADSSKKRSITVRNTNKKHQVISNISAFQNYHRNQYNIQNCNWCKINRYYGKKTHVWLILFIVSFLY